ncbi:helix-turn-helix domain-containing protein [Bacillus atrophaeus]|uniref:Transcriptional regulator n=1 Tax=Bacillus atrophaeus (strain 1942) TaxID=720555 RepID=A0ABM5LY83_BACA1|nr:helix-turn-helix domain-containing protein [Bacillus atrophaeus]AMR62321.1 transcriptional regulator [Bacillus subtilis subsp. globigii]ADP32888.1 putative transcriptional regulator [Bacillus atrophaeus 1942]AIK49437.1 helix-turn-helix domain protein [Bacillus atrophaeus subsp. globigii]EIM11992.1 putative transcriptional regulator [Bacillus atrophaeus C89]KFK84397.1 helix-turn-helix domain protein [Bacillus atrophaeus]
MTEILNPVLSVDFKREYSTLSDGVEESLRVCIDAGAIHSGLIKELGANRFSLLMAIVSHMDASGKCFPSQRKLAELTGQSPTTVNKNINEMLEITFKGQHILRRELTGGGKRQKSIYYIHQGKVTNTDVVDETVKPVEQKKEKVKAFNSRDVANYWGELYKDTFGKGYVFNYGAELTQIKKKLLPNFDEETLKAVIKIAITQYQQRWASEQYPLPTIFMLTSWLANTAYGIHKQGADKAEQLNTKIETAKAQDDTDRAMSLFNI